MPYKPQSPSSQDIRHAILTKWNETLSRYGNLFSSDSISGTSPPSVFVGSYNYPKVYVGPMVPPIHGDTSMFDSPENWKGKTLEEIVNFRLNLVRGIQKISIDKTDGKYIENLQEVAMSSKPADSDLMFENKTTNISLDGESAPFGPVGKINSAKFSGTSSEKQIERIFYDKDLKAQDAILNLYNSGIEISKIQKCFSIGMLGKKRKLVPTRWSITATDDVISKSLVSNILNYNLIDSCYVFYYEQLGNSFSVILFPHRWVFEMIEAWYSNGIIGFGSDSEDARGIDHHPPVIAGAYFAAKLGVAEYLSTKKIQAGVVILREIRPEYAIPVGVWQVRQGIREAMKQHPIIANNFSEAMDLASKKMSVGKSEWISHGKMSLLMRQKTLHDFF